MARSGAFFEALTTYYSSLAYDALSLMRKTREEIRTDEFDCHRTASRTAGLWLDASDGWWSALLVSATPPVPTILIAFDASLSAHSHTTKILVPGRSQPRLTKPATAGNERALEANIRVEAQSRRDEVTIYFSGLEDPPEGTYTGYLYVDETLLAQVVVEVHPKPVPAGTKSKARAVARKRGK